MDRSERFVMVALVVGYAAAGVACNDLLGLGDYVEVSCITRCPPDAALPNDGSADDASDAFQVIGEAGEASEGGGTIDAGTPALKYTWPQWHMPNPAAAGLANDASYSVVADASVIDNITKLEWEKTRGVASTAGGAALRCASLATGGHGDWRVPTRIELASLIDYMKSAPPQIDPVFEQSPARLWTASRYAGDAGLFWIVDFANGEVKSGDGAEVRCVRGPGS
jgi:hypothetical protein